MLTTLYLTKVFENKYWSGEKKKINPLPATKMDEQEFKKYSRIAKQLKK